MLTFHSVWCANTGGFTALLTFHCVRCANRGDTAILTFHCVWCANTEEQPQNSPSFMCGSPTPEELPQY
ncbi:hypothetical protein DPMN_184881 [Dreissena polymorpha]|uniref:Uncharacterized protein n=1 Tax=Dreissena polymorpha TaxID=45954 RepID=A0A9D4DKU9_DREPO|nr:hypothetical protein DPMN_184881 [Dreissena polymorpha]